MKLRFFVEREGFLMFSNTIVTRLQCVHFQHLYINTVYYPFHILTNVVTL